jgi:hypothetical protein
MKLAKIIFIIISVILLLKAVIEEDFADLFLAIFILLIGVGLETV